MCEEVLSVVPCDPGILIFHRPTAKGMPSCWCVHLEQDVSAMSLQHQWYNSRWNLTEKLPDDILGHGGRSDSPVFVPGCSLEFQRWQLTHTPPRPTPLVFFQMIPPIGRGGRPDVQKGSGKGKVKRFETRAPLPPPWGPTIDMGGEERHPGVAMAVKQKSQAWQFVDKHLRLDVDFAIAAVQNNPEAADAAAAELEVPVERLVAIASQVELRFDKDSMLQMIRESGWKCLRLAGSTIRQEKDLQMEAVAQSWKSLKWMVDPDLSVILDACRQDLSAAELVGNVDEGMKAIVAMNFPEVVKVQNFATRLPMLAAVRKNGLLLQLASPQLREDVEVVEAAVKQNPDAIRFARGAAVAKLKASESAPTPAATQQAQVLPWMAGRQEASSNLECCCCAGDDDRPWQRL
eukprot:symbB.v1.2.032290.t1/scaffold3854.1/size49228/2